MNNNLLEETLNTLSKEEQDALLALRNDIANKIPNARYFVYDGSHIITVVIAEDNYSDETIKGFESISNPIFSLDLNKISNEFDIEGVFYDVRV